jgi:hypothetical protein
MLWLKLLAVTPCSGGENQRRKEKDRTEAIEVVEL